MKLRALIVDDEAPARSKIKLFLASHSEVEVVGEATDGEEAVAKILELKPDLLFLDIQMPRGDGFDVLGEIWPHHRPLVIFTTAYDEYAVRAFEVAALDYLLKPFTQERFSAALERAARSTPRPSNTDSVGHVLAAARSAPQRVSRILVREPERLFFVNAADVQWIEAEEKYCRLHTRNARHLVRESISSLEARLVHASFVRVHRSALINLEALEAVIPVSHGDALARLKSGASVKVGRTYREALLAAMGAAPNAAVP